jgi:hypothetical protein
MARNKGPRAAHTHALKHHYAFFFGHFVPQNMSSDGCQTQAEKSFLHFGGKDAGFYRVFIVVLGHRLKDVTKIRVNGSSDS